MLCRSVLSTIVLVAAGGAALAADLPSRQAPAPYFAPSVYTWTGFYAGVNAGAAFDNAKSQRFAAFGPILTTTVTTPLAGGKNNTVGFAGGGQIGYNFQFNQFVLGGEADIQYLSLNRNDNRFNSYFAAQSNSTYTFLNNRTDGYFGTVRARFGFAFDRALLYVTGGLAYGGSGRAASVQVSSSVAGVQSYIYNPTGTGKTNIGYALGGGVEYAVSNNVTVRGEYLFVDIGTRTTTLVAPIVNVANTNFFRVGSRDQFSVARLAVNYKF